MFTLLANFVVIVVEISKKLIGGSIVCIEPETDVDYIRNVCFKFD